MVVVTVVGFVQNVRRSVMNVSIESVKLSIDKIAEEAYEEGYKDATEWYSKQPFSAARTDLLSITVQNIQKDLKDTKRKLALATKLLRYAQTTPCGSQGQFDRFFEEGYDAGHNDVSSEEM